MPPLPPCLPASASVSVTVFVSVSGPVSVLVPVCVRLSFCLSCLPRGMRRVECHCQGAMHDECWHAWPAPWCDSGACAARWALHEGARSQATCWSVNINACCQPDRARHGHSWKLCTKTGIRRATTSNPAQQGSTATSARQPTHAYSSLAPTRVWRHTLPAVGPEALEPGIAHAPTCHTSASPRPWLSASASQTTWHK